MDEDADSYAAPKLEEWQDLEGFMDEDADSYAAPKLEELFQKFVKVKDIVIKTRKSRCKGSAIVVLGTKEAAFKPEEIAAIMMDFDEPGTLAPTGLFLGGTKYKVPAFVACI